MTQSRQNKRKVFALGETVLDLVSEDGLIFRAIPGGSVLNASVSLGRMGIEVDLISEFGADEAGNIIAKFLAANAVKTRFSIRHPDHKTSLALAFLDSRRNAAYSFYHNSPEKLAKTPLPDFQSEDVLLFGSYYAVKPGRRDFMSGILKNAVGAGSVIYYDLNIRKAHESELGELLPAFINNMAVSSVLKGSDEDFFHLFGLSDPEAIYEIVRTYTKVLIITTGSGPLHVFTPAFHRSYPVPLISPVSTIGAGDNFNAGFIYGLVTSPQGVVNVSETPVAEMDRMVGCGLAFATQTCLSAENYIQGNFEPDFWKKYI